MGKITQEQVEAWLGTDDNLAEAIEIITDIANGDYKPEVLREDIEQYE